MAWVGWFSICGLEPAKRAIEKVLRILIPLGVSYTPNKSCGERSLVMNGVWKIVLMVFCLISFVGVSATEAEDVVYSCSSDDATGFDKENWEWVRSRVKGKWFKFKFVTSGDKTSIRMADQPNFPWECSQDPLPHRPNLYCHNQHGEYFSINPSTGNFVIVASNGWLGDKGGKRSQDSVSIGRGTCSKF